MVSRFAAALVALAVLGAPGLSGAAHEACPPHCAHAVQADPGCGGGEEHCPSPSLEAVPCCTEAPLAPGASGERAPLGSTLLHHAASAPRAAGFESADLPVSVDRAEMCAASAAERRSVVLRL
jgi:hypothetical protein